MIKPTDKPTVIALDGGAAGLTAFERKVKEGKLDLNSQRIEELPADMLAQTNALLEQQEHDYIGKVGHVKQTIATTKDFKSLPLAEQERVQKAIHDILKQEQKTPEVTSSKPNFDFLDNLSKIASGDEAEEEVVEEVVEEEVVEEVEETTKTLDPKAKAEPKLCPCCRWDTDIDVAAPTDEDKSAWVRSLLGVTRFEKRYPLMGGKLEVTFRTRTLDEQRLITDQLVAEVKDGRIPSFPSQIAMSMHIHRMRQLQMAVSLVHVTGMQGRMPELLKVPQFTKEAVLHGAQSIADLETKPHILNQTAIGYKHLFGNWPEPLFGAVFKEFSIFDDLCLQMTEAMRSPSFWSGIGG